MEAKVRVLIVASLTLKTGDKYYPDKVVSSFDFQKVYTIDEISKQQIEDLVAEFKPKNPQPQFLGTNCPFSL